MEVIGRYGKISFMDADTYIGRSLQKYGEYGEEEIQLMSKFIDDTCVVFDVGANVGALAVGLAKKAGTVFAFEPQPEVFKLLSKNSMRYNNLVTLNNGLGEKPGVMFVPLMDYNSAGNFGGISLCKDATSQAVEITKLDDFVTHECDLIKIDVEGMECDVLRGAQTLITNARPVLYVENDREHKSEELINLIMDFGYVLFWHLPLLYNKNNFFRDEENIFDHIVSCNMLCLPKERINEVTPSMIEIYQLRRIFSSTEKPFDAHIQREIEVQDRGWVAVARFGGIGDNLIAASVLPLLKRQGYKVEVITDKKNGDLFKNNPHIDKLAIKKDGDLPNDCGLEWQKWFKSRSSEYEKMIHLSHTIEGLLAFWPSQTAFYWPDSVRRPLCDKSYLEIVHDIAEVPYQFGKLFYPTKEEIKKAVETKEKVGKRMVGWVVRGSRGDKVYPYSPMAIARIIKECDVPVVLFCGVKEDYEAAAEIQKHVARQNGSDNNLHVASTGNPEDWPVRRALTFAMHCDVMVGPDTGVMWAVAMESMPKIMLLSHASEENITKHWYNTVTLKADSKRVSCYPCHRLHDTQDTCRPNKDNNGAACISDISIDEIINQVRRAL